MPKNYQKNAVLVWHSLVKKLQLLVMVLKPAQPSPTLSAVVMPSAMCRRRLSSHRSWHLTFHRIHVNAKLKRSRTRVVLVSVLTFRLVTAFLETLSAVMRLLRRLFVCDYSAVLWWFLVLFVINNTCTLYLTMFLLCLFFYTVKEYSAYDFICLYPRLGFVAVFLSFCVLCVRAS